MNKDYSIYCFLQSLCKHMSFSESKSRQYLALFSKLALLLMLFVFPQHSNANTFFNPDNRDHLNVYLPGGAQNYSYVDFRILCYDYDGIDDNMDDVNIYFQEENGSYTKIINHGGSHDKPNGYFYPVNTQNTGFIYGSNIVSGGDRRYHTYRWAYPQRLSGRSVNIKVSYRWDVDHNNGWDSKDRVGDYYGFTINFPVYPFAPVITNATFEPVSGNNVRFNFSKTADYPLNKVYLYSDAARTNLLKEFDVTLGATSGTSTFLWDNPFTSATTLYVKYAMLATDPGMPYKQYYFNSTTVNKAYVRPSNFKTNYDNCLKSITLSWNANNNSGEYSDNGKWVVERKLTTQTNDQYVELSGAIPASQNIFVDELIDYDKEYNYRLRFVPAGMDKSRVIPEFENVVSVSTKRTVLNTLSFETFTKTTAENPKIKLKWTPNWCYNELIKIQRKNTITGVITNINVISRDNNNTNTITDENLTENLKYQYRLVVETEGRVTETPWQTIMIKDEVKYKSVTSSKGTLADRIQLKWNVERNDLSNSFFIKRQLLEEGKENPQVDIANITTNGKYYSYDDRDISPGVLYKYTLGSLFTLQSGDIDTVYYNSDIIGYAQANGTISGRITFGSGTAVDSVSVFANNANESESLYRAISFSGAGGYGEIGLKPEKHGCVKDGFTWQGWILPLDTYKDMAIYECLKEYSIWYEGSQLTVYLDEISDFDSQISYDMSSIPANEYFHATVSFDGDATLKLYINGKEVKSVTLDAENKALVDVCQNTVARRDTTIAYLGDGFLVKGSFKGNVDDLRLWDRALTAKEIADNYNRYLNGGESGLIGYWQFDEGLSKYAFDKSNYKKTYNEHHITFTQAETTSNVPTLNQLSIKGITDKNGNYLISGIPFTGEGSTYSFIPSKQSHEFEPSRLNRHLTFQSSVHNAVDFKDISSFKVKVKVTYDNTSFPVDSVDVLVDGSYIYKDKKILCTDANGECIIDVPIGIHTITVNRRGHTFVDGSKSGSAIVMNFVEPILGEPIKFYDTTKTILAGRVVGGVDQASKPLGFGLSKANIGEAEITIEVPDGDYQLNLGDTVATVKGFIRDTINSVSTIAAKSKVIKVTTDPQTGEFRLLLPPLKYKVSNITTRGGLTGENFNLQEFKIDPNLTLNDTATINKKKVKFDFNKRLDFTYRVDKISIDVIDPTMPEGVFGDSVFMYTNLTNNTKVRIPMYAMLNNNPLTPVLDGNSKPSYKYGLPVYQTTNIYKLRVFAYEQYSHPDNLPEMEEFCKVPASNAKINIQNELGRYELPLGSSGDPEAEEDGVVEKEYVFNNEGVFDYTFKAGFPNLVSPYTLGLKIEVDYKDKKSSWDGNNTFKAIVMGDILTGTDFVTSGPDLISFVLRDPPGSNSYSYMEKGTTVSNSYSFNKSYVGSESLIGTINYGQSVRLAVGFGVAKLEELEIENKTGAGVEVEQSAGHGGDFNISTTTTERIETSSSSDYVGRRADVYVGTSTNLFFGTSKRLNPVLVGSDYVLQVKDEKVGNMTANTNFKYTYAHITETLIPSLTKLRNDLIETVTNMSTASAYADKARYVTNLSVDDENFGTEGTYRFIAPSNKTLKQYSNEVLGFNTSIKGWVAQLAKEEDDKVLAMESREGEIYTKTNESSDAGVTSEKSITICGSSNKTSTSSYTAQGVIKTENGLSYNDLGFQIEFETKHGAAKESVSGTAKEYCTTYGYVFSDENAGDYLSVDVYTPVMKQYDVEDDLDSEAKIRNAFDSYSGAPVFITRGGRTSCPYEPQEVVEYSTKNKGKALGVATLQVEKPLIKVANPFATEIPSGKEATYKITLSNLSESNSAGWYLLTVDEKTNSKGAIITVDGQTLGNGKLYYVVPGEPMEKVLKLKQSSLDELEYENIKLLLSSTCDDISSSISLSAQFVPSCSDVTLDITNKIVNTTTSDILPIKIKDYNREYKNFGGIILKYKTINQDESAWSTIRQFVNDPDILALDQNSELITSASIDYLYSMKGKDDQTYQFKAVTVCAFGTGLVENESEVITIIKDMVTPTALGTPSPSNGILTPESEISITFNEDIQNTLLNSTNFKAEAVMNGYTLKHNVGLDYAGASEAYSEQQFNLQSVPVSVEAWIRYSQSNVNANATIFSIGEGSNQLKLQLNGNTLKAIAGAQEFTGNIVADENWQYISLGYNPQNSRITVNVTGQMNNNVKVIDQTVTTAIEPSGRFSVGKGFKGNMSELSLWIKDRGLADMAVDRNTSKSGRETGLIGYWPMNEGYGTLAADKVNSRNLTVNGSWYLERMGKAIVLNGTNQNILISTETIPVNVSEDFSIEFWFKSGVQANKTMFSCGKGLNDLDSSAKLSVGFDANSKLTVYSNGNTHLIPGTEVQDNQWHHFALCVLRTGNASVLIDGVVKYQIAATKFGALGSYKMSLGARYYKTDATTLNYTTDQYFAGALDEVRIWKGALTAENIRLDMRNKLLGSETGLLAYYPFEAYTVNNASQLVISESLKDAIIPASGSLSGGTATGNATFTASTPTMKEARPKENVYFNWTSTNNKIVFNVLENLDRIENCILEFTVDRVLDLNGNRMSEPKKWTVYVDNNRLKWADDAKSLKKEVLAPMSFKASIVNNSGKYENFVIDGLPNWLSVDKSAGQLNPLGKTELTFTVDNATNIGSYESRIILTGNNNIQEMLPVSLKVTGTRPDWTVNPHEYNNSMSITGQVKIDNIYQEDTEDMLAAFIGTRCVGLANPVFNKTLNSYIVYLDVYGLDSDENKAVKFSLWDAGTGRVYPDIDVTTGAINFVANAMLGSVNSTKIFNATDKIEQQLALKQGWNWFSTNVVSATPDLLNQFKTSIDAAGIQIKSRNDEYIGYANNAWVGTLTALNQTSMYMVKTNADKTVKLVGSMAKPADLSSKIVLNPQWNWIGYIPQFVAPVKEALSNLTAREGDQIKGQVGFATYTNNAWHGSLQYLSPGMGYKYYSTNTVNSSFNYPSLYLGQSKIAKQNQAADEMRWSVNVAKYQMSMTVTAVAELNGAEITNENVQLAVFVGDECRGTVNLKYVESLNKHIAFLMVWGNVEDINNKISFKAFDSLNNSEMISDDLSLSFVPDNITGSPDSPYKISFVRSGINSPNNSRLSLYPNPATDVLHLNYEAAKVEQIEVYDNMGRKLGNYVEMDKTSINIGSLVPGVYTLKVKLDGIQTNHMFIKK